MGISAVNIFVLLLRQYLLKCLALDLLWECTFKASEVRCWVNFTNHWAEQKPYMLGLGWYKFWLFRSICIIRPLPSSGRIMLPLTNEVVHFEILKLVFRATWKKCVSFFLSPPSYPAYREGFGSPFTFIYIAFTFLQKHSTFQKYQINICWNLCHDEFSAC